MLLGKFFQEPLFPALGGGKRPPFWFLDMELNNRVTLVTLADFLDLAILMCIVRVRCEGIPHCGPLTGYTMLC